MSKLYIIKEETLTNIGDAIREKSNNNNLYTPSQMALAIRDLSSSSIDQSAITFNFTNPKVTEFVTTARQAYTANSDISIANEYKEAGTTPQNINISASGKIELIYFDGGTIEDTANGTYTLKHFSPTGGRISVLKDNGNTEQSRLVQPTGTVRFLDLNTTRNARDLGGWPCDGGTVKYGMIYRMTVPNGADADTLLNRLGIRHQFDLRGQSGSYNSNFPVPHYHIYSGYVQYTRKIGDGTYDSIVKQIIEDVIDATVAGEPLLFHCAMGCDRTGTLAFYLEGILGMSDIDIDIEYELSSLFDDKNAGTEYYYRYRTDNRVTNETDWVGLKNMVSGYSGSTISAKIINYLLTIGVSAARLNAFRTAMIDGTPSTVIAPAYTVTNMLTGCTTSNTATTAEMNQAYSATITANTGYKMDGASVSITMGGIDITSSVYSNNMISISSVTGNIVIQIAAAEISSYTNQIPISTDANGNVYNTTGYKEGYRLNSSGVESASNGYIATGFIPFSLGQEIIFDKFSGHETSNGGIYYYDSSHNIIATNKVNTLLADGILTAGQILDYTPASPTHNSNNGNMTSIENVAYIRISAQSSNPTALSCGILGEGQQGGDDPTPTINYTITNALTNCSSSNNVTSVESGGSYTAIITASNGYTLTGATVSITMGGTDITSTAYSNGAISIANVTGNIIIQISAMTESQLKELFDPSVATINQRFSSSGTYSARNGNFCTDYIPVSGLDTSEPWRIYIKDTTDATRFRASATHESVLFCKSDKSVMNANYGRLTINTSTSGTNTLCKHNDSDGGVYVDINRTGDGNQIPSTYFDLSQVAYIRICMTYSSDTAISDTATLANISVTADNIMNSSSSELVNLFDSNDADVSLRCRINSSGNAVAYADNQLVTGFIPATDGDVFRIETDKSLTTNNYTGMVAYYDSSKTYKGQNNGNSNTSVWAFSNSDMTGICTLSSTVTGVGYVRFCIAYTDIGNIKIYKQ